MNVMGGLILEGGGMRGVYTAGALDCLLEHELYFQTVYAVSAGACHATSYLSGQKGRAARSVIDYVGNWRYASFRSLLLTGDYFGASMAYRDIPMKLLPFDYDRFRENKAKLYAVCTNCDTGRAEYMHARDLATDMDVIRASSSLPLLSRDVRIDGRDYLDGGLADPIPLKRAMDDGLKWNLVILTQHEGYRKQPESMLPLMRVRYRRRPELVLTMSKRHEVYNSALELIDEQVAAGRAVVIRPKSPVVIDRLEKDADKLRALYRDGYRDMGEKLDEILLMNNRAEG